MMQIIPAVDIRGGRCVRLLRGDFDKETVFSGDPVAMAEKWQRLGASIVHVVDLDGAKTGEPNNMSLIQQMCRRGVSIQVGGGIRRRETASELLAAGAKRIILGTAACEDPGLVTELVKKYPDRIIVGVDSRGGRVSVEGWTRESDEDVREFCIRLAQMGVPRVIMTDIARDGMMQGPNLDLLEAAFSVGLKVIASGGVSSYSDLHVISDRSAGNPDLEGVIVGRALYDGTLSPERVFGDDCRKR